MRHILLAALATLPALFAQSESTAPVPVLISKYQVKPGATLAFEDLVKKYAEAYKKAGRQHYMVWRTAMGDQYEYITMTDFPGLAAFDGPAPTTKAFGERGAAELGTRLALCISGVTRQLWHLHSDQSIVSAQDFKLARVTELSLRGSSAVTEHNNIQRKLIPAMKTAGRKNAWLLHLDYGGDDYRVLSIMPFEKYADAAVPQSLTSLVGAEESKRIVATRAQITVTRNAYLWAYRPELSFRNVPAR